MKIIKRKKAEKQKCKEWYFDRNLKIDSKIERAKKMKIEDLYNLDETIAKQLLIT